MPDDVVDQPLCGDAEAHVLGGILLDNGCLHKPKVSVLVPQDFSSPVHKEIFEAMLEIRAEGKPVDTLTLADQLERKGKLQAIGGARYLVGLQNDVATVVNIEYYAEMVKNNAGLREIYRGLSREQQRMANGEHDTPQAVLADLQRFVTEATRAMPAAELSVYEIDEYEQWLQRTKGKKLIGHDTGFPTLNTYTKGLSGLWIVGGGPKMYKSTFSL